MPLYFVEIQETLSAVIRCEAANEQDVLRTVRQMYREEQIQLTAENLTDVNFQILSGDERKINE
ncbi:MAG: hypothetical protein E7028_00380 [Planctomycetaceae bacterium]|nr:hypothetical protein [Planctomycetaceae bacterium]MBQ2822779.1 DpnD/PcfM family protein [Thermoguttaceae bacterium]